MKVLKHLNNPTIFSHLSRSYPVQSLASTGFYRDYNSYPSSTIIRHPNQIFSNTFAQYNPSPSINYSHLPITNAIPANHYSYQSLPINYSVPSLSYSGRYNSISSISYSSLPTGVNYSRPTYQSLNPHLIPSNFYASQSSNLSHNFGSSNSSNYNLSSYRSSQVAVDSNPPIQFTDHFLMPIKNAQGSYDKLDLKQIAHLVPIGFTGGILDPEIDVNNKLKICNSVSLSEVQSKIWIRNGDNLVELPNHLLEKNPQIYEQNLHYSPMITPQIYEQNLHSSPMIITSETSFLGKHSMPFPTIMRAFNELNKSLIQTYKIKEHEKEILGASFSGEDLSTSTQDKKLTSISDSTTPSSPLSLSLSPSQSPPSTTINPKLVIMTLDQIMVNGDLKRYGIRSEFIIRFTEKPNLTGRAIIC